MNNLPWRTEGNKILNCKGVIIGGLGDKDNNELICRAVNNHESLLDSLKSVMVNIHFDQGFNQETTFDGGWSVYDAVKEAIKQAEEGR